MTEWQTTKPPNEVEVEVEWYDQIIRVKAIWGRDGVLPHWKSTNDSNAWSPSYFQRWRQVEKS